MERSSVHCACSQASLDSTLGNAAQERIGSPQDDLAEKSDLDTQGGGIAVSAELS